MRDTYARARDGGARNRGRHDAVICAEEDTAGPSRAHGEANRAVGDWSGPFSRGRIYTWRSRKSSGKMEFRLWEPALRCWSRFRRIWGGTKGIGTGRNGNRVVCDFYRVNDTRMDCLRPKLRPKILQRVNLYLIALSFFPRICLINVNKYQSQRNNFIIIQSTEYF